MLFRSGHLAEVVEVTGATPYGATASTGKAAIFGMAAMVGKHGKGIVDTIKGWIGFTAKKADVEAKVVASEVNAAKSVARETTNIASALTAAERTIMNDAFKGKADINTLSPAAREAAAQVFENAALNGRAHGQHALGVAYQNARAGFMRGTAPNPGPNALQFGEKNGIPSPGKASKGDNASDIGGQINDGTLK